MRINNLNLASIKNFTGWIQRYIEITISDIPRGLSNSVKNAKYKFKTKIALKDQETDEAKEMLENVIQETV